MSDKPEKPVIGDGGGSHPKVRDDDRRGTQPRDEKGRQLPFAPTDEQRIQVRAWAASLLELKHIATKLGVGVDTVKKYFAVELAEGEAECIASVSTAYVNAALNGDRKAMRVVLERKGGWASHHKHTGADGGPIEYRNLSESEVDARIKELEAKYGSSDAVH